MTVQEETETGTGEVPRPVAYASPLPTKSASTAATAISSSWANREKIRWRGTLPCCLRKSRTASHRLRSRIVALWASRWTFFW